MCDALRAQQSQPSFAAPVQRVPSPAASVCYDDPETYDDGGESCAVQSADGDDETEAPAAHPMQASNAGDDGQDEHMLDDGDSLTDSESYDVLDLSHLPAADDELDDEDEDDAPIIVISSSEDESAAPRSAQQPDSVIDLSSPATMRAPPTYIIIDSVEGDDDDVLDISDAAPVVNHHALAAQHSPALSGVAPWGAFPDPLLPHFLPIQFVNRLALAKRVRVYIEYHQQFRGACAPIAPAAPLPPANSRTSMPAARSMLAPGLKKFIDARARARRARGAARAAEIAAKAPKKRRKVVEPDDEDAVAPIHSSNKAAAAAVGVSKRAPGQPLRLAAAPPPKPRASLPVSSTRSTVQERLFGTTFATSAATPTASVHVAPAASPPAWMSARPLAPKPRAQPMAAPRRPTIIQRGFDVDEIVDSSGDERENFGAQAVFLNSSTSNGSRKPVNFFAPGAPVDRSKAPMGRYRVTDAAARRRPVRGAEDADMDAHAHTAAFIDDAAEVDVSEVPRAPIHAVDEDDTVWMWESRGKVKL